MVAISPPSSGSSLTGSIAGRAGYTFEVHTMLQGFACHARGVEILEASPAHVRARVRSKRTHEVDLRATAGRLVIACSCPARAMGVAGCKHAWAALLEVDRQGGLEDLRGSRGVLPVEPAPERSEETTADAAPLDAAMSPHRKRPRAREEPAASTRRGKDAPARASKTKAKAGPARGKAREGARSRDRARQ